MDGMRSRPGRVRPVSTSTVPSLVRISGNSFNGSLKRRPTSRCSTRLRTHSYRGSSASTLVKIPLPGFNSHTKVTLSPGNDYNSACWMTRFRTCTWRRTWIAQGMATSCASRWRTCPLPPLRSGPRPRVPSPNSPRSASSTTTARSTWGM